MSNRLRRIFRDRRRELAKATPQLEPTAYALKLAELSARHRLLESKAEEAQRQASAADRIATTARDESRDVYGELLTLIRTGPK